MTRLEKVNAHLLQRLNSWLTQILPGGIIRGHEYVVKNPTRGDATLGSFTINISNCLWADFATRDGGNDPISLYAYVRGMTNGDAFRELEKEFGLAPIYDGRSIADRIKAKLQDEPREEKKQDADNDGWNQNQRAPADSLPQITGNSHWIYRHPDDAVAFVIERFDLPDGKKTFTQWSHFTHSDGRQEWRKKGWSAGFGLRPLLGSESLKHKHEAPVLVVEGEKTWSAAHALFPEHVVLTWAGGGKGVKYSDWSVLTGRLVFIWPDNDPAGSEAAFEIKATLNGCAAIVPTGAFDLPAKWDLADLEPGKEEWAREQLRACKTEPAPPPRFAPTDLAANERGVIYSSVDNVVRIIANDPKYANHIWFDTFHQKIFTDRVGPRREWNDADDTELTIHIQRNWEIQSIGTRTVTEGVVFYAKSHPRNEPQDWVKGLVWDGQDRLDMFLTFGLGVEPSEYTRAASKNFFIALVARILDPGCKVDNMIVLEGAQGKYKSTALKLIGDPWFMESSDTMGGKAFAETLAGKLLCEIAELDSFSKADSRQVKRTITTRVDRRRVPFERHAGDFPRITVFVGTTNEDEYLEDPTGGRRFWPMKVGEVDLKFIAANRDQLYAEAMVRYKSGESWWEMPDTAADQQSQRRRKDPWEDTIIHWTDRVKSSVTADGFSLISIAFSALSIEAAKLSPRDTHRLSEALRACGWEKRHTKKGNIWVLGEGHFHQNGDSRAESAPDFIPRIVPNSSPHRGR